MKERDGSGSIERGFGVGIVIALIGLAANPALIVPGGLLAAGGEVGRRNRESARKK